jgi:hypothetical protein
MKKLSIIFFGFCNLINVHSQISLFSDDFDNYLAGNGVVASNSQWSYWAITNSDALISSLNSFSPENSAQINGQAVDLVLPVGPLTSGRYNLSFKMLIPTGSSGAYFNALHNWSATSTTYEWGMDMFFDGLGANQAVIGSIPFNGSVNNPIDEWFDIKLIIDLDLDSIWVKMNENLVAESQWSLNNADGSLGTNQLSGFDFYGTDMANGQGNFFIDDVLFEDFTGVNVGDIDVVKSRIYPNPASNKIQLILPRVSKVQVFDCYGTLVFSEENVSSNFSIDLSEFSMGTYLVQVNDGYSIQHEKLIVE